MLTQLAIRNFGLIEDARIDLGPGLNVITGETGVGKSMLVGSLALLRGERARADLIRAGSDEAGVTGFFILEDEALRAAIAERLGLEAGEEELLLERRLRAGGRHRALVNGREVPHTLLAEVGARLFEVQGQRSQLALLQADEQLRYLDRYARLADETSEFGAAFADARALAERIDRVASASRERNDRRLFLGQVVEELGRAALRPGEREALERELEFLEERDEIRACLRSTLERFYEGEECILDSLGSAEQEFRSIARLHAGLGEFLAACESARAALGDGMRALQRVDEEIQADPGRLGEVRERVDNLVRLEERYRRRGDKLLEYRDEAAAELAEIASDEEGLPESERDLAQRLDALGARARALSKRRRQAAKRLAAAVAAEFADLGMKEALFEARLEMLGPKEGWLGLHAAGADRLEFIFGPNPGEPPARLRDTASGGELSRVMLALRRALVESDGMPILIFDEIDAGVGGRLGAELGRKLREIAAGRQVICVTHLPQIASYGVRHFRVTKQSASGRTSTRIELLDDPRRIEEVASMIRGAGTTATSLAEAREMLQDAAQ